MLEEHEQQFTPRWLGVAGDDHVPRYVQKTSFLFINISFVEKYMEIHEKYIGDRFFFQLTSKFSLPQHW